jgi:hypothetical protein
MSVSIRSRYWNQQMVEAPHGGGTTVSLPVRRPLRPLEENTVPHVVHGTDTVESVAAQYYGRSDLWWQVADATPPRFPLDFVPGERLRVPSRVGVGRVELTRTR